MRVAKTALAVNRNLDEVDEAEGLKLTEIPWRSGRSGMGRDKEYAERASTRANNHLSTCQLKKYLGGIFTDSAEGVFSNEFLTLS